MVTGPIQVTLRAEYAPWYERALSMLSAACMCIGHVSPRLGMWVFVRAHGVLARYGVKLIAE